MIILAVLTSKILLGVKTGEKLIKIANQFLHFLPIAKYSLDLRVHKIKRITTLKRTMTRGNVLACTTIFLNAAVFCENLLLLIVSIFFLLYVTIIHTIHSVKIHKSGFNRSVHFLIINIDVKSWETNHGKSLAIRFIWNPALSYSLQSLASSPYVLVTFIAFLEVLQATNKVKNQSLLTGNICQSTDNQ